MSMPFMIWLVVLMHRDHTLLPGMTDPASTTTWVTDYVLPDAERWSKENEGNVSVTLIGAGPECSASDLLNDVKWDWTITVSPAEEHQSFQSANSQWHVWTEAVHKLHDWIIQDAYPPNHIIFLEPPLTAGVGNVMIKPSHALDLVSRDLLSRQSADTMAIDHSHMFPDSRYTAINWDTLVLHLFGELLMQNYLHDAKSPSPSDIVRKVAHQHSEYLEDVEGMGLM